MSCRICKRSDSGTTDLCASCEARAEYEQALDEEREMGVAEGACWLARFSDKPCEGRLVRCHLLPRSLLKREFPYGAYIADGMSDRIPERHRRHLAPNAKTTLGGAVEVRSLDALLNDPRGWVWGCSGASGVGAHHGDLDHSRTLKIPRHMLPPALEDLAAELGLTYWLAREYGELEEEAA